MNFKVVSILIIFLIISCQSKDKLDYMEYHKDILNAEKYIINRNFNGAIVIYDQLFEDYDFEFIRDILIAAQLSLYEGNKDKCFQLISKSFLNGAELSILKKR